MVVRGSGSVDDTSGNELNGVDRRVGEDIDEWKWEAAGISSAELSICTHSVAGSERMKSTMLNF